MTAVSGLNSVQSGANQQSSTQSKEVMGKDQFMTLLVAQLQNQDPLNPMDSTGFTAQLAQFSSLEQLQNVNTNLSSLSASQSELSNVQAISFIGKTILSSGSEFQVNDGTTGKIHFNLSKDAEAVQVSVYDAAGNFVRNIQAGQMPVGDQIVNWDGINQDGGLSPDGKYSFEVMAVDSENEPVNVTTYARGKVTGVNYKDGTPYLLANQIEIPLSSVISVAEPVETEY
jgi:flagellar basal-body rod modification protein FlgD